MPIAKFELPDGRIGRFEVPEGTTPEQAQAQIMAAMKSGGKADLVAEGARMAAGDTPTWEKGLVSLGAGLMDIGQGVKQLYLKGKDAVTGSNDSPAYDAQVANEKKIRDTYEEVTPGGTIGRVTGSALPTILIPAGKAAQVTGNAIGKVAPTVGARVAQSMAADAALTGAAQGALMATGEGESRAGNAAKAAAAGAGTVGLLNLAGKVAAPVVRSVADGLNAIKVNPSGMAQGGQLAPETIAALQSEGIDFSKLTADARARLVKMASDAIQGNPVTPQELARAARLESLPVPIQGTKGQLSKDFAQNQLEQSLVKSASSGKPLQERFSKQEEQLLGNLDAFRNGTGARIVNDGDMGRSVDAALKARIAQSESNISRLYREAEKQGETLQQIDLNPLVEHLNKNPGTNPFMESQLKAMKLVKEDEFGNLVPTHTITLNDLEKVRQRASKISGTSSDGTIRHDAGQLVAQIDAMIPDSAGGKAYQAARAARRQHAMEFEEPSVIQNVVGMKSRTDRSVPYEDVFNKTVINGSIDDLKTLKRTLLANNPETRDAGVQALKDIRGQAMQFLKDAATNNAHGDTSEAALRRAYNKIGPEKMRELFGGNTAKQFENFLEAVKDLKVAPKGTQNPSGTAGEIVNWVERILSPLTMTGRLGRAAVSGVTKLTDAVEAGGKVAAAVDPLKGIASANEAAKLAQQNERLRALMNEPISNQLPSLTPNRIKRLLAASGAAAAAQ